MITPMRLAFVKPGEEETMDYLVINYFIDFLFFIDILVIFNTGFFDEYLRVIENRKEIAKKYLTGWFIIDIIAIVPFDLMTVLDGNNANGMVRFAKIPRLYKLVKLTRLVRVFKLVKQKN